MKKITIFAFLLLISFSACGVKGPLSLPTDNFINHETK
ncbi:lipoprotein [SAR86 cluster bacterium]|nr:lipoprotein [SAR86 cluster bacterium]